MIFMAPPVIGHIMQSSTLPARSCSQKGCLLESIARSFLRSASTLSRQANWDVKWSGIYRRIMSHRQTGDYDINLRVEKEQAAGDVRDAQAFVEEVEQWLRKQNLL